MSRSVDLFIDADVSLAEMSGVLGECLGAPLRPEGLSEWVFDQGQVQAKLSEHPYRDDGELLFSRYRFVVSARVANDVRPQDSPQAALLRQLAHQIQQGPAWPLLVVHDLQYRDGLPAPGPSLRIEDAAGEGGPGAGDPGAGGPAAGDPGAGGPGAGGPGVGGPREGDPGVGGPGVGGPGVEGGAGTEPVRGRRPDPNGAPGLSPEGSGGR